MQEDSPIDARHQSDEGEISAEARLIRQIRAGSADAGHQFVREYYPAIYRYLLYLTENRELAEDLTQEVFVKAWRGLDRFDERRPLRPWLYRIAHREFLQALRRQRPQASLEALGEVGEPASRDWTEAVALRDVIRRLPAEEAELVILHYLEGYSSEEISRIVGRPAGTIRYRLSVARTRLQQVWGDGDLSYLNEVSAAMRRWAWLPLERLYALEARIRRDRESGEATGRAALSQAGPGESLEAGQQRENEIIDRRLTRKVTLGFKAIALADLCERLRMHTGIDLRADVRVADEKVTLFCSQQPLRDVMRQLSRAFGYAWRRSGREGAYRYDLVQETAYLLMEAELRTRDRNAALLVLEREIERYRPHLDLSPDEALARAQVAPAAEKSRLENLAGYGWGAIQLYFRLTPAQHAALRAGTPLEFSQERKPGALLLPPEIARGVLQSLRDVFFYRVPDGFGVALGVSEPTPKHVAPTALVEARAAVTLSIRETEPGRIALTAAAGAFSHSPLPRNSGGLWREGDGTVAVGTRSVPKPDNRTASARLVRDPTFSRPITFKLEGSVPLLPGTDTLSSANATSRSAPRGRVTTADILEALHRATELPIVADFYTRLFSAATLAVEDQPVFASLHHLTETMDLRWQMDDDWLQFRSVRFYEERLKEVPNRLLSGWASSRRAHGVLTLDDLVEMAQLPDPQLDAREMAEGAREIWGLAEWDLVCSETLRPHLRFLAGFTAEQRQEMITTGGLSFLRMTLAQQQQFIASALQFDERPLQSLSELDGAALKVIYDRPGEFAWVPPGRQENRWVVPLTPGPDGHRAVMPAVRGQTPEEARAAASCLDARLLEAMLSETGLPTAAARQTVVAGEIVPTELNLWVVYIPGLANCRNIYVVDRQSESRLSTW